MWDFSLKSFLDDLKRQRSIPPVKRRGCDMPGCSEQGEYRAPKSRIKLDSYYWFCLEHVRSYNAEWDFFKGLSQSEIESHMYKTAFWDRPSWNYQGRKSRSHRANDRLRENIYRHFTQEDIHGHFTSEHDTAKNNASFRPHTLPQPLHEALSTMGLKPPVSWKKIKNRYKTLAKKYHPDTNPNDMNAEEMFKKVTLAYTILKASYEIIVASEKKE